MFIYVRKKEKKKLEAPLTQYSHSHIVQGSPFSFFFKEDTGEENRSWERREACKRT